MGYNFQYYTDLTNHDIKNTNILPILEDSLPKFENPETVSFLIELVRIKEFYEATGFVLEIFKKTRRFNILTRRRCAAPYDNALYDIGDKRYIREYLEILDDEIDANNLSITMRMLAKWQVPEAKPVFIKYLHAMGELRFTAIEALSYYLDTALIDEITSFLKSVDKNIVKCAKKAISRLEKYQH